MILGGAARNRMLIKGGSSFNALVRALKQDVVTGAAPSTTASDRLMYEVDKVRIHAGAANPVMQPKVLHQCIHHIIAGAGPCQETLFVKPHICLSTII